MNYLRPAVVMTFLFTLLLGGAYPLAITGIAQVALPAQANGSMVQKDGAIVGSILIGQAFASPRYFHGRPSATSAPDSQDASKTVDAPYNAANSSGSNLGPLSQKLLDRVKTDVEALEARPGATIPVDAVTTSGSGLDPHISPAFAETQIGRIVTARGLTQQQVRQLVAGQTVGRLFGVFGEPRVNVLSLNQALDALGAP